jgi:hypothetical protein
MRGEVTSSLRYVQNGRAARGKKAREARVRPSTKNVRRCNAKSWPGRRIGHSRHESSPRGIASLRDDSAPKIQKGRGSPRRRLGCAHTSLPILATLSAAFRHLRHGIVIASIRMSRGIAGMSKRSGHIELVVRWEVWEVWAGGAGRRLWEARDRDCAKSA